MPELIEGPEQIAANMGKCVILREVGTGEGTGRGRGVGRRRGTSRAARPFPSAPSEPDVRLSPHPALQCPSTFIQRSREVTFRTGNVSQGASAVMAASSVTGASVVAGVSAGAGASTVIVPRIPCSRC